ncbi:MAG TPA: hypothetical protein VMR90_08045 [Candidatus Cybelea sp.]|nr:hypothetical protein [Candidatus Cybelea sp.]
MKRSLFVVAVLILSVSVFLAVGAQRAGAQGPAGAGASTAAQGSSNSSGSQSSHSLNPIKWVKRDKGSKDSANANASRSDIEKKLTPKLQAQGVLPVNANATDACAAFTALNECLATLHASHNLGMDFNCLRASVTGVHASGDMTGCKAVDGEKAQNLNKAIHMQNPDADAKGGAKNAEQQAKDDLKDLGA